MNELTQDTNMRNIESVRKSIHRKIHQQGYMATEGDVTRVVTDMDHTPYSRFYRGVYFFPEPIIMEREAGWRPVENACYLPPPSVTRDDIPDNCFEAACTTTFPCRTPGSENREQDCLVRYR